MSFFYRCREGMITGGIKVRKNIENKELPEYYVKTLHAERRSVQRNVKSVYCVAATKSSNSFYNKPNNQISLRTH